MRDYICKVERGGKPRNFPSFSEGLSLRVRFAEHALTSQRRFPFLFGRAFIEASPQRGCSGRCHDFPSFLEGLSLRQHRLGVAKPKFWLFPYSL